MLSKPLKKGYWGKNRPFETLVFFACFFSENGFFNTLLVEQWPFCHLKSVFCHQAWRGSHLTTIPQTPPAPFLRPSESCSKGPVQLFRLCEPVQPSGVHPDVAANDDYP